MSKRHLVLCMLTGMTFLASASASERAALSEPADIPPELLKNITFLHGHPDLRWRVEGNQQLYRGDFVRAAERFTRAARYADKPSQAAIAELLWDGKGVPRNRPLAYAWMDLAAERGYRSFLMKREAMWQALDDAEREQAIEVGTQLYADYGDDVAKPRSRNVMRRERSRQIGSRTGADVYANRSVGKLPFVNKVSEGGQFSERDAVRLGAIGSESLQFFNQRYWHPETYWSIQDSPWQGEVIVHPLQESESDPR